MHTIDVKTLAQKQEDGEIDLIDVRMPVEFREVHAVGAQNVPLDRIDPAHIVASRNGRGKEPLYLICRSGNRSGIAAEKLMQAGIDNVVNVDGGTNAWVNAGLPVRRGQRAVSLERQVRIAAGSLVLLGFGLSFLNSYLIGISVFVGAGLVFAGITNTCGMGILLSKMPWNRCEDGSSCYS